MLSSTRYKGDFLDRRQASIEKNDEKNVVMKRRAQYEVRPEGTYCGETFRLLVGSTDYATQILDDDAEAGVDYPETATVKEVPIEFKAAFQLDPEGALRDVIGISTDVLAPFITRRNKIVDAVVRGKEMGLLPCVHKQNVVLGEDSLPIVDEGLLPEDKDTPRYIHVDLSRTGDRCGLAMVKESDVVAVQTGELLELMPRIVIELAISIEPNAANPIDPTEIRTWILALKKVYGLNIKKVTYDGYDSRESILLLRKAGILSDTVSMDTTTDPYLTLRTAFYQDRIDMVDNEILRSELAGLEYHKDKDKVDHPPNKKSQIDEPLFFRKKLIYNRHNFIGGIFMPRVRLHGGHVAFVDEQDLKLVYKYKWYLNTNGYAAAVIHDAKKYKATGDGSVNILMHRLILGAPPQKNLVCDHRDRNRTNNKRNNLRWATHTQNLHNSSHQITKSGYKGVKREGRRWVASCNQLQVGRFDSAKEAAMAYDKAARHFYGEFAYLNFPDDFYEGTVRHVDFIPDKKIPVSDYPGVTYFGHGGKRVKRWRAVYRKKTIGYFHTELVAYLAYRSAKNTDQSL